MLKFKINPLFLGLNQLMLLFLTKHLIFNSLKPQPPYKT
nr:MAG TPA: hypothetical protein [Caudoviricetes sp.]DAW75341.1 MAG TPA: hypothetical protein [Caudoviricetes sp.]